MANRSLCTSCLRTLRQQVRLDGQQHATPALWTTCQSQQTPQRSARHLSTTPNRLATPPKFTKPPSSARPPELPSFDMPSLAAKIRKSETLRSTTEPYIAYGSTQTLVRACSAQCAYIIPAVKRSPPEPAPKNAAQEDVGEPESGSMVWYTSKAQGGLALDVTFNTWAQVVMLHMYCLTVRLRCFPADHVQIWHQNLLDHFFYMAEDRMAVWHNMSARGTRNKYLKDLWMQWRGLLLSYDEGLIKGDAVLATAIWRNMFKGKEDADLADVALVTAYMRQQLKMLDRMDDEEIASGIVAFGSAEKVKELLERESPSMNA